VEEISEEAEEDVVAERKLDSGFGAEEVISVLIEEVADDVEVVGFELVELVLLWVEQL
jgi:hypothetical protein